MNFEFLTQFPDFKNLYQSCSSAEKFVFSAPTVSMTFARQALEFCVKFIYDTTLSADSSNMSLFDILDNEDFKKYINDQTVINEMHYIRKMGNSAVHDNNGKTNEAIDVLESLLFVVGELFITLKLLRDYPVFVVPKEEEASAPATVVEVNKANTPVTMDPNLTAQFAVSMRHTRFDISFKRNEEQNREMYIKASLREAGWPIASCDNMAKPYCAGTNITVDSTDTIDYVLYGLDGKPMAIIEYSETKENVVMGRRKANRVAKKMEVMYGLLPVIYYTNGYMIYIIDQLGFAQRRIFCFNSLEELDGIIQKRGKEVDFTSVQINDAITDRKYQHEAINAVCSTFAAKNRGSLIVMATGTGKTRVAISIVDVLIRSGVIKNVLFLADRTSLIRQAQKNFKKLLPNLTTSLFSGESLKRNYNANLVFSTYQTMIRLLNGETRGFGVGRFDLIIVDEAHRSVFAKYGFIFKYFDALLLGLTATPKFDQDRNVYEVFRLGKNEPDYAYELESALSDGYLVGFSVKDRTTDILRRGFRYKDLTPEEIQELETAVAVEYSGKMFTRFREAFGDSKLGIRANVINRGTIREMLDDLMENGLKLSDGMLGKTIIFAKNHEEAETIVEEFNKIYGAYGPNFCKLIDSKVAERYTLIDKLEDRNSGLQIAVSVDMLETGVDIPDILNLVFFKGTWSKITFMQMIGRGTRLSKDIYGEGKDKKGFLVLDYFDNFGFFSEGSNWSTIDGSGRPSWADELSASQRIIDEMKMDICWYIQTHSRTDALNQYREELISDLVNKVRNLKNDNVQVQYNLPYVNKFRAEEWWTSLTEDRIEEITTYIIPLFEGDGTNAKVRRFDSLMYSLEAKGLWLEERQPITGRKKTIMDLTCGGTKIAKSLQDIKDNLLEQSMIPEVKEAEEDIKSLTSVMNENFDVLEVEKVRKRIRHLMVHLPHYDSNFILDMDDTIYKGDDEVDKGLQGSVDTRKSYPERAQAYLANTEDPEIVKISNLEKLTDEEKQKVNDVFTKTLGTAVDYAMWSDNKPMLPFLRSKVGISNEAIQKNFGSFYNQKTLSQDQYAFLTNIIDYAKANGDIKFTDLIQVDPFSKVDIMQLFGPQLAMKLKEMVKTIHEAVM